MKKLALIAILCVCTGANANLKAATEAGKFGEWHVLQSIDKMTDAITCTGIYQKDYGVQLSGSGLYIKTMGGIESIKLRFGNDPASPMRLAQKMEKDIRAIVLEDDEFRRALLHKSLCRRP